ncbi:MAG: hypothetical protein HQL81_12480 [Magnetococcales bacterium]|nr:hypothetical protein [Magnetococcales bacterium]
MAVGLITPDLNADVAPLGSPNGEVTIGDAVVLARAAVGLITWPPFIPDPPLPPLPTIPPAFVKSYEITVNDKIVPLFTLINQKGDGIVAYGIKGTTGKITLAQTDYIYADGRKTITYFDDKGIPLIIKGYDKSGQLTYQEQLDWTGSNPKAILYDGSKNVIANLSIVMAINAETTSIGISERFLKLVEIINNSKFVSAAYATENVDDTISGLQDSLESAGYSFGKGMMNAGGVLFVGGTAIAVTAVVATGVAPTVAIGAGVAGAGLLFGGMFATGAIAEMVDSLKDLPMSEETLSEKLERNFDLIWLREGSFAIDGWLRGRVDVGEEMVQDLLSGIGYGVNSASSQTEAWNSEHGPPASSLELYSDFDPVELNKHISIDTTARQYTQPSLTGSTPTPDPGPTPSPPNDGQDELQPVNCITYHSNYSSLYERNNCNYEITVRWACLPTSFRYDDPIKGCVSIEDGQHNIQPGKDARDMEWACNEGERYVVLQCRSKTSSGRSISGCFTDPNGTRGACYIF